MPNQEFAGKCVLVTGAAAGIGRRIAERFHANGAQVIGLDCATPNADLPFRLLALDIADHAQVAALCAQLQREIEQLDVLVNAAGILRLGTTEALTLVDWHRCLDVNVSGTFYLLQQWIPLFKRQRHGAIVTIASNAAHVPRLGMTAYCASKAALASLCQCVGLELAPYGVRSNLISPGSTDTAMLQSLWRDPDDRERTVTGLPEKFKLGIPLGKLATTDDIADAALFFASTRAGHVTLQDLVIDGGATLGA